MSKESADQVRGALDRIERTERNYRAAFFVAVAVEAMFFVGFLSLADLKNRLHLLLLLATVAIYSLTAAGLVILGAHVSRCAERVIRAVELYRPTGETPDKT